MESKERTGYPSIDKPWLKYYSNCPKDRRQFPSILETLHNVWENPSEVMIKYYDRDISAGEFYSNVSSIAKSLTALQIRPGDSLAVSLESVPEFLELFLACEQLGIHLKSKIGNVDETLALIQDCSSRIYITHNYIPKEVAERVYKSTRVEHIIVVPPLSPENRTEEIRPNIQAAIKKRYSSPLSVDSRNITWENFLHLGSTILEPFCPNLKNPLFSAFTSGTMGIPKEVIHTSESILGVVRQLAFFPFHKAKKDTWLLTILPPTLVAVVVAMMLYPLADRKVLILDPFCEIQDLDIEMMSYQPNCWALIPLFFDVLLKSKRIPKNYDMSYFKLIGFGAEPMTRKFTKKVLDFLKFHHCDCYFGSGYGQSEGGSDFTVAPSAEMILSGSSGIPLIDTTISIFKPRSTDELTYGEIGEICKCGPGLMLGYTDKAKTSDVLKLHSDGNVWLHTGDYGFMTKDGQLFVLGREQVCVYPNKKVYPSAIENKIADYDGVEEAVIIPTPDENHPKFDSLCLFVVPTPVENQSNMLDHLKEFMKEVLLPEEYPTEVRVIDSKPISHFKTDRLALKNQLLKNI